MRKLNIVLALLFSAAAFAQEVQHSYDQNADFKKYRTYRWEAHPKSMALDPAMKTQLAEAFNAELAKKGLSQTSDGNADLVLVFQLGVRDEKEITFFNSGWNYGPGWRRGWYGPAGGVVTSTTNTFQVGSLVLDIFDASQKHLVWRAVASKAIDEGIKPDKRKKNMAKAAEKVLKNFPPRRK